MHYCKYFSKLTRGTLQLQELNKQLQVLAASYRALAADHAGLRHEAELEQQRRRPPPPLHSLLPLALDLLHLGRMSAAAFVQFLRVGGSGL